MEQELQEELITYLRQFTTEDRIERMAEVLKNRTRHLSVVLEDIYQPHNASAVIRSCDCFGIQDVHVIENRNAFDPDSGVSIGAHQWVTIHRYADYGANNTEFCFNRLRSNGYSIIAMTPHHEEITIDELQVGKKTALVFGTELEGLSEYAMNMADGFARIPMYGFSESLNISVSVALVLYETVSRLRKSNVDWHLSEAEKTEITLEWLKQSIRAGEKLQEKYLEGRNGEGEKGSKGVDQ